MKTRHFAISAFLGFAAGLFVANRLTGKTTISPEKALKYTKNQLKETLDIEGSWIQMVPETLEKNKLVYTVYKGGLTANEGGVVKHYDFAVDTKTGTVLELIEH